MNKPTHADLRLMADLGHELTYCERVAKRSAERLRNAQNEHREAESAMATKRAAYLKHEEAIGVQPFATDEERRSFYRCEWMGP